MTRALRGFLAVGLVSTLLHYAVMVSAVEVLRVAAMMASAAGFLAGALLNYVLNRRITFASRRPHSEGLPRFTLMVVCGVTLNSLMLALGLAFGLHYLPAQVMATVTVMGFNFACMKYWVFVAPQADPRG